MLVSAIDLLLNNTLTGLFLRLTFEQGMPESVMRRTKLFKILDQRAGEAPEAQST